MWNSLSEEEKRVLIDNVESNSSANSSGNVTGNTSENDE
jgi:hypothetical protein